MSLLRKILFIIGFLLLIVVLAVASIPLWFDINDYKQTMISEFEKQTGRSLAIPGELKLSVFPRLAVTTGKISMGNARGFGKQAFLQLDKLHMGVKLLPLFEKRIEADEIVLSGLRVNLQRHASGTTNWDDLVKLGTAAPAEKQTQPGGSTPKANLPQLALAGVSIENAQLDWQDRQNKQQWLVTLKTLQLNTISLTAPIPFRAEMTVSDRQQTELGLRTHGQVGINLVTSILSVPELQLNGSVKHPALSRTIQPAISLSKLQFDLDKQVLDIPQLSLSLDETSMDGSVKVMLAPTMRVSYNLSVNQLDVDKQLALLAPSEEAAAAGKTAGKAEPAAIPFAAMTAIPANGKFTIGKLKVVDTHWSNIELQTHASAGKLQIKPMKMSGYDTTLLGEATINSNTSKPVVTANLDMQGLQVSPLLKDMLGKDRLHGQANFKASISSQGHTVADLRRALDGKLALSMEKGILKGIDVDHYGDSLKAKLKGEQPPAAPADPQTEFAELRATATIEKGLLTNRDLRASTLFARCAGAGKVDIAAETIDYVVSVKTTSSSKTLEGKNYEELDRDPLDIKITGPWSDPAIRPDYQKLLKRQVEKKVDAKLQPKKDAAKKKIDEKVEQKKQELKDRLKGLFNR